MAVPSHRYNMYKAISKNCEIVQVDGWRNKIGKFLARFGAKLRGRMFGETLDPKINSINELFSAWECRRLAEVTLLQACSERGSWEGRCGIYHCFGDCSTVMRCLGLLDETSTTCSGEETTSGCPLRQGGRTTLELGRPRLELGLHVKLSVLISFPMGTLVPWLGSTVASLPRKSKNLWISPLQLI